MHVTYVIVGRRGLETYCFEWPSTETEDDGASLKGTQEIFLVKAPPWPFVILLCIISMLQVSVTISAAFFMQISLTAQQSVSYASSFPNLHTLLLHSPALSLLFT